VSQLFESDSVHLNLTIEKLFVIVILLNLDTIFNVVILNLEDEAETTEEELMDTSNSKDWIHEAIRIKLIKGDIIRLRGT
jgi:hypothetical protein